MCGKHIKTDSQRECLCVFGHVHIQEKANHLWIFNMILKTSSSNQHVNGFGRLNGPFVNCACHSTSWSLRFWHTHRADKDSWKWQEQFWRSTINDQPSEWWNVCRWKIIKYQGFKGATNKHVVQELNWWWRWWAWGERKICSFPSQQIQNHTLTQRDRETFDWKPCFNVIITITATTIMDIIDNDNLLDTLVNVLLLLVSLALSHLHGEIQETCLTQQLINPSIQQGAIS